MKNIAVIEDDIHIGDMLEEVLRREGYGVLRAYSGTEALYLLSQHRPDLVLLDLMLPGLSGEQVLPQVKDIPVIVLSAKVDVEDKVKLLLGGAADYITKPFDIKELLARISVQLRKSQAVPNQEQLRLGRLCLHPLGMELLMEHPGQVISKSTLLDRIAQDTPDCTERSLKQHISNLRKKLQEKSGQDYIETIWGIGFRLREPES